MSNNPWKKFQFFDQELVKDPAPAPGSETDGSTSQNPPQKPAGPGKKPQEIPNQAIESLNFSCATSGMGHLFFGDILFLFSPSFPSFSQLAPSLLIVFLLHFAPITP